MYSVAELNTVVVMVGLDPTIRSRNEHSGVAPDGRVKPDHDGKSVREDDAHRNEDFAAGSLRVAVDRGNRPKAMRRVVIMGPPGSGKSTLARELGVRHGLPVFHLDQAYWTSNWVAVRPEVFSAEVSRLAERPTWVIEGNYIATIDVRLRRADTVVYLDVSSVTSLARIVWRMVCSYGRVRPDAAAGCPERLSWSFLAFVSSWNRVRRSQHLDIVGGFQGNRYVVRSKSEMRRLLAD